MYSCIRIRIYKYLIVSGFAPRLVACERERASWREDKRMKEREGGGGRRDDSSGAIYHASPKRVLKAMKLKAELLFLPLLSVAMRKSSCLPPAAPTPASPPPLPLPACCLCALPTPSNPRSCVTWARKCNDWHLWLRVSTTLSSPLHSTQNSVLCVPNVSYGAQFGWRCAWTWLLIRPAAPAPYPCPVPLPRAPCLVPRAPQPVACGLFNVPMLTTRLIN